MSLVISVTRFAWFAQRLASSKRPTRYASDASCSARRAVDWNRKPSLRSWANSRTSLWNGIFRINSWVLFRNLLISIATRCPGLYCFARHCGGRAVDLRANWSLGSDLWDLLFGTFTWLSFCYKKKKIDFIENDLSFCENNKWFTDDFAELLLSWLDFLVVSIFSWGLLCLSGRFLVLAISCHLNWVVIK